MSYILDINDDKTALIVIQLLYIQFNSIKRAHSQKSETLSESVSKNVCCKML